MKKIIALFITLSCLMMVFVMSGCHNSSDYSDEDKVFDGSDFYGDGDYNGFYECSTKKRWTSVYLTKTGEVQDGYKYSIEMYNYKDANKKINSGLRETSVVITSTRMYSCNVWAEQKPGIDLTSTDGGKTFSGTYQTSIEGEEVTCVMKLKKKELNTLF